MTFAIFGITIQLGFTCSNGIASQHQWQNNSIYLPPPQWVSQRMQRTMAPSKQHF